MRTRCEITKKSQNGHDHECRALAVRAMDIGDDRCWVGRWLPEKTAGASSGFTWLRVVASRAVGCHLAAGSGGAMFGTVSGCQLLDDNNMAKPPARLLRCPLPFLPGSFLTTTFLSTSCLLHYSVFCSHTLCL